VTLNQLRSVVIPFVFVGLVVALVLSRLDGATREDER
jgi:hypothetical protein